MAILGAELSYTSSATHLHCDSNSSSHDADTREQRKFRESGLGELKLPSRVVRPLHSGARRSLYVINARVSRESHATNVEACGPGAALSTASCVRIEIMWVLRGVLTDSLSIHF